MTVATAPPHLLVLLERLLMLLFLVAATAAAAAAAPRRWQPPRTPATPPPSWVAGTDWLLYPQPAGSSHVLLPTRAGGNITLTNGIVTRTLARDSASGDTLYTASLRTAAGEKLAAVVAEAAFEVNGRTVLVGGRGPAPAGAVRLQYTGGVRVGTPATLHPFTPGARGSSAGTVWPPRGARLEVDHMSPCSAVNAGGGQFNTTIAYEVYDNTASFGKTVSIRHSCALPLRVCNMTTDLLVLRRDGDVDWQSDASIAQGGISVIDSPAGQAAHTYGYQAVVSRFSDMVAMRGPGLSMFAADDEPFTSFLTVETVHDAPRPPATAHGMGRRGLETTRSIRTLAPQTTQSPVTAEVVCVGGAELPPSDPRVGFDCYDAAGTAAVHIMIDQAADVGVEVLVFAQNMNNTWRSMVGNEFQSEANISWFRDIVAHAQARGIEVGAYQLLRNARSAAALNQCAPLHAGKMSMSGFDTMDLLPPLGTGRSCHNQGCGLGDGGPGCCSLCAATTFYDAMEKTMLEFWDDTGMTVVEQDGAETSTPCSNASHTHHHGLNDSMWAQWRRVHRTFHAYLERGGFIMGMPGHLFEGGQAKVPGGYDEMTWSLPRWRWIARQRQRMIADPQLRDQSVSNGIRYYITPLVPYHPSEAIGDCRLAESCRWKPVVGYESTATLEPLDEHLVELEWALSQTFGTGIMSVLRGYRLYQGERSRAVMAKWIGWFKRYRRVLTTEFVTLSWTNETGVDAILHRAPQGYYPDVKERALAVAWNTRNETVVANLTLPLYFAGLTTSALVREKEGASRLLRLDANFSCGVAATMPPLSITYFVVEASSGADQVPPAAYPITDPRWLHAAAVEWGWPGADNQPLPHRWSSLSVMGGAVKV